MDYMVTGIIPMYLCNILTFPISVHGHKWTNSGLIDCVFQKNPVI